jgi:7-cyano-7-deazaguanine reductase
MSQGALTSDRYDNRPRNGRRIPARAQNAFPLSVDRLRRAATTLLFREYLMTREARSTGETLQLGQMSPLPSSPEEARLDRVPNPHPGTRYVARFTCPEFTSLCPVTGQPDFGILIIDYVPGQWLVESKSLKLFLASFRNHGAFHEDCTVGIGKRLVDLLEPEWFRIGGYWYPRGGIPIDVFWQTGQPPSDIWLPDQGVGAYRGR